MTYALVQQLEGSRLTGGQRSISVTYGSPVTAGNLLVCVVSREVAANTIATVAQVSDGTNKWRQATETIVSGNLQGIDIWVCESATASTPTVTATLAAFPPYTTTGLNIWVAEYSGNSGFELLDQFGNARGTTTSLTVTTAFNLAGNHDLALSVVTGNMSAATVPSGYTSRVADATQQFWIADNVDTGTSAGSTLSAAWTGLTAGTLTTGIIVTFKEVGVSASTPHLLQASYNEPDVNGNAPPATIASQAYPVNPAAGSTLVAFITGASYVNYPVTTGSTITVTDTAGNVWNKMADFWTPDPSQGLNWSVWLCRACLGGATTLTCTWKPTIQTPAWLLLEFASMPPLSIDSSSLPFTLQHPGPVSTTGAVQAGDMGFAAFGQFPLRPFSLNSGWVTVGSDTAGGNCLQMFLGTPAGTLTATTGTVGSGVCSAMVCGLRLAPGLQ